jgi:hypothetical protein
MFRPVCLGARVAMFVAIGSGATVAAEQAAAPAGSTPAQAVQGPKAPTPAPAEAAPTEAMLGMPIYPGAQYIATYDAGRGQRYILFGSTNSFAQLVAYYRTALKQKGELVFDAPATHMFEVGKFREESMAFPPGVTIKDYTWGGSDGYLNPRIGAQPARFPTIIQFVPVNPADLR